MDLKNKLKQKFKQKFHFHRPRANQNQCDQAGGQTELEQQLENEDDAPTGKSTSSRSPGGPPNSSTSTSAPTHRQTTPSPLPDESSWQSQPEPRNTDLSINELWHAAYEGLRQSDEELIGTYEDKLRDNFSVGLSSTVGTTLGARADRRDLMNTILQRKMEEVNRDTWKLKFGSSEYQVKDIVQPVLGVVNWANEYITAAVSANPVASVAWAGVSLLLPLLLNPAQQAASLAKGLEYISSLIVQGRLWEALYTRRCEMQSSQIGLSSPSSIQRIAFKDALKTLYQEILRFQVRSYCYYVVNGVFRIGQDIAKWNEWDDLLKTIQEHESRFASINAIWEDTTYAEERSAADTRHAEAIRCWQTIGTTIGTDISGLLQIVQKAQEEKERDGLLDWLCTLDPSEAYNAARDKHTTGTSDWLIRDSKEFKAWETSASSLLWLSGKPGCGKSILSSSIIKHLRDQYGSDPRTALAYFFFSFSDPNKQRVDGMLASLLKQIYARRPDTPDSIQNLREYKARGDRPDTKTLETAILATTHGFSATFIIVDALDECPSALGEREKLLTSLRRLVAAMPGNVHVLCTSRAETDVVMAMCSLLSESSRAKVDITTRRDNLNHDIGLYIDETLASDLYKSWPCGLKTDARKLLIERADGMFQYVSCQFDALRVKDVSSEVLVRKELEALPIGLDESYNRLLLSLNKHFRTQIISVLKWLSSSNRDLRLEELAEIFILRPECEVVSDKTYRLFDTADVIRYMSSLIVVQRHPTEFLSPKYVRLAHFTIKEYLMSSRIAHSQAECFSFTETDAHLHIAHSSLAYCLHAVTIPDRDYFDLRLRDYAFVNWFSHLEMVPRELWSPDIAQLAARALAPRSNCLRYTFNMDGIILPLRMSYLVRHVPALKQHFYTALKGFFNLTHMLIGGEFPTNPYLTQEDWEMALCCAALGGFNTLVQSLIDKGAEYNSNITEMGGVLHAAAYQGRLAIVDFLLDRGANINAQNHNGESALQAAIFGNHLNVVQLLVRRGCDINASSSDAGCAITSAVHAETSPFSRHLEFLRFLLDSGADIDRQCPIRGAALHHAAANIRTAGGRKCVRLLLERGADVNLLAGKYGYPLHAMCLGEADPSEIELLLEMGADVNACSDKYGTALRALFSAYYDDTQKQRDVAKLLLDRGADINMHGGVWGSALEAVCASRHSTENAQFLIENGADIGFEGGLGSNDLQAACRGGNFQVARLLLDMGANVNAPGGEFGSALQAAAHRSETPLVDLLLNKGADINKLGGSYGTALQAACAGQHIDIVRILLDHGAEVNVDGGLHGTALQAGCAAHQADAEIAHMLIEHGANVHQQGGKFGSAWHAAAAAIHDNSLLLFLLEHGIDIDDSRGRKYATALHTALEHHPFHHPWTESLRINRIGFLLDHGANVNVGGGEYGFPLQAACASEEEYGENVTKSLLEKCPEIHANTEGGVFGSALQASAYSGQTGSVRMLLDRGANVNVIGGIHRSALNAAIFRGYWDIVEVLLERGAVPDTQPDEVWLEDVRGRLGRAAVERYWKFWEKTGSQWNDTQVHGEHQD